MFDLCRECNAPINPNPNRVRWLCDWCEYRSTLASDVKKSLRVQRLNDLHDRVIWAETNAELDGLANEIRDEIDPVTYPKEFNALVLAGQYRRKQLQLQLQTNNEQEAA